MNTLISTGEAIDKWTILKIKLKKITDDNKKRNIFKELDLIDSQIQKILKGEPDGSIIKEYIQELENVNLELWDIEEKLRMLESNGTVNLLLADIKSSREELDYKDLKDFIELARSVYLKNDQRAYVKKQLNILLNSNLIEEKSYKG